MNAHLEELASLYLLDQLDARERTAFEARLALDPELAALVRDLESTLARHIRALPQHPPSAGLLARIERQLDAPAAPSPAASAPSPVSRLPSSAGVAGIFRWGLAAVIALGVATLAIQSLRRPAAPPLMVFVGLDAEGSTLASLPLGQSLRDPDARFVQLARLAEKFWQHPDQLPVKSAASTDRRGYALFDPASRQGLIAIESLPAPTPTQRYHLWIVDTASGAIRDAGTLPHNPTPRGLYTFSTDDGSSPSSARLKFFLTVEDAKTSFAQPRGPVVLGARL